MGVSSPDGKVPAPGAGPTRLTRRSFLSLLAAGSLAAAAGCAPSPLTTSTRGTSGNSGIRAGSLLPVPSQDDPAAEVRYISVGKDGARSFTLLDGASQGAYTSPPYQADFLFNGLASSWKQQAPEGSQVSLEMRASSDGQQWSAWYGAQEVCGATANDGVLHGQLISARGRFLQYRLTLSAAGTRQSPRVADIRIDYIDSSQGPSVARAQGIEPGRRPAGVTQPAIISRAGWGCPEPYSSDRWPPGYKEWRKIALHDTITQNDDPDPAATVRAIWHYHASTLGWGDIGYNYLIDSIGNIYEGRFGGENVTGGHVLSCYNPGSIGIALLGDYRYADVSPAMEYALVSLLATKTYHHNILPLGSGDFGGTNYDGTYSHLLLPNIFAHRDLYGSCGNTHTDPGTNAFGRMQTYRQSAWDAYPLYGEAWVGNNAPQSIRAGQSASVSMTVKNTGRLTWSSAKGFRLGYRWIRADGTEALAAGGVFQRAELPQDVSFGQQAAINAQVVPPSAPGSYTLRWDMVQETVTWFADQGNQVLDKPMVVEGPAYAAQFVGQGIDGPLVTGGTATAYFDVKNTGTAIWTRSGPSPVLLGTWSPQDRSSVLYTAGAWPIPSRAGYASRDQVAPGQTARFTFTVSGPSQPAVYREHFSLVAEGTTFFGPDMWQDFNVVAPTYIAEFVSQGVIGPMFPGDRRPFYFDVKNTGTATWTRNGSFPVRLGTWSPQDHSSPLYSSGIWPNQARAAYLDQEQVAPGETGRFTLTLTAPALSAVYREHFSLVAEGRTWFGPDMWLDLTVLPSFKSYAPELFKGQGSV